MDDEEGGDGMGDEHEGKGIRNYRLKSEVSKKFAVRVKALV